VANEGIGIFDSGVGGLTVARAVLRALPGARIVYFADNRYAPYGDRPAEQVARFADSILRFLESQRVGAIVAGCNLSWTLLREGKVATPSVPVFELLGPAAEAAARATQNGVIGVLATRRTVESEGYPKAIQARRPGVRVVQQACPALVPLVERGELDSPAARRAVAECVAPLLERGADTIVLGCTHYPFLRPLIAEAAGAGVAIVDPAEAAGAFMAQSEALRTASNGRAGADAHRFLASGSPDLLRRLVIEYLRLNAPTIEQLDVHPGLG